MGILIAVVGVSGVGKTSLVHALGASGDFDVALEEHTQRPFQALAKEDPQYALANQLDYFQFRAEQEHALRASARPALVDGGLDLDFHGFTRLFHERGWLGDHEFDLCRRVYTLIRQLLPSPELFVHLTASVDSIHKRLAARDRINLATSDDAATMDRFITEWLENVAPDRVVRIDVSDEDKAYAESVTLVRARLMLSSTDMTE